VCDENTETQTVPVLRAPETSRILECPKFRPDSVAACGLPAVLRIGAERENLEPENEMKPELEKALELLRPPLYSEHNLHAAHSEIATALERQEEQLAAAAAAILRALHDIKHDAESARAFGPWTETFLLLRRAAALLLDQKESEIEAYVMEET